MWTRRLRSSGASAALVGALLVSPSSARAAGETWWDKDSEKPTALELQTVLMGYSDRFVATINQAHIAFQERDDVDRSVKRTVNRSVAASFTAAITIAAGSRPDVSLLDLAVLASLERLAFQDHWKPKVGEPVEGLLTAYRQMDDDIWTIVSRLLREAREKELRAMIVAWHEAHPEQYAVAFQRVDLYTLLQSSGEDRASFLNLIASWHVLAPVSKAERELEQTRLMAERALYMSSRLLLIGGVVSGSWIDDWLADTDLARVLADFDGFNASAARLVLQIEQLPAMIRQEGNATIDHAVRAFGEERQRTLEDLVEQGDEIRGMLQELREAAVATSAVTETADRLADRLGFEPDEPPLGPDEDPTVVVVRDAVVEMQATAAALESLLRVADGIMDKPGWETVGSTLDEAEETGAALVDRAFLLGAALIVLWFAARLLLHRLTSARAA